MIVQCGIFLQMLMVYSSALHMKCMTWRIFELLCYLCSELSGYSPTYTCIDSSSGSSVKYPDLPVILCICYYNCDCMSSLHTIHISHISWFLPICILIMVLFTRKSDLWMFNLILEDLFAKSIIKVNALIQSLGTIKNLQIGDELWVNSISLPINWKQCMPLKTL